MSVAPNPNNVLSEEVFAITRGAASVAVVFAEDGGAEQATPTWASDEPNTQLLPVLGLRASTDYALQVVAESADGGIARSNVVGFSTSATPTNVKHFTVTTFDGGTFDDGYVVVSKLWLPSTTTSPAQVVDRKGNVVWYVEENPAPGTEMRPLGDGTYQLIIQATAPFPGTFAGTPMHLDDLGNVLATYAVPDIDGGTDQHDMSVLPNGDVLLLGCTHRDMDMTAYDGGADTFVVENTLWMLHPDGGVGFQWDTFDHTSIDDMDPSISRKTTVIDATHVNAYSQTPDGNYLISIRHMDQVMKIDPSGNVLWRLGGARSDFTFVNDPYNGFCFQHDAQQLANGNILMFDNGNCRATPQTSRAVEYQLDTNAMTATMVWQYLPSPNAYGWAMGSAQRLANGDTLIAFGTTSRIDEVDANGNVVWRLVDPTPSFGFYRAYFTNSLY